MTATIVFGGAAPSMSGRGCLEVQLTYHKFPPLDHTRRPRRCGSCSPEREMRLEENDPAEGSPSATLLRLLCSLAVAYCTTLTNPVKDREKQA